MGEPDRATTTSNNSPKDTDPVLYMKLCDLNTKYCLQNGANEEMEELGRCVRIVRNVLRSLILIWSNSCKKPVHVYILACEYLCDRIAEITWIDC